MRRSLDTSGTFDRGVVTLTLSERAASDCKASVAELFQKLEFLGEGKVAKLLACGSFAFQNLAHPFGS